MNNLGTPASYDGKPTRHTALKPDSIESMELTDAEAAGLRSMDEEEIAIQFSTLICTPYRLTSNTALATALYSSYDRSLAIASAATSALNGPPSPISTMSGARSAAGS